MIDYDRAQEWLIGRIRYEEEKTNPTVWVTGKYDRYEDEYTACNYFLCSSVCENDKNAAVICSSHSLFTKIWGYDEYKVVKTLRGTCQKGREKEAVYYDVYLIERNAAR